MNRSYISQNLCALFFLLLFKYILFFYYFYLNIDLCKYIKDKYIRLKLVFLLFSFCVIYSIQMKLYKIDI